LFFDVLEVFLEFGEMLVFAAETQRLFFVVDGGCFAHCAHFGG
jgi:hypothetical protein